MSTIFLLMLSNIFMQQLANGRDVVLAVGVGEQAVVADAMEAGGRQRSGSLRLAEVKCSGYLKSGAVCWQECTALLNLTTAHCDSKSSAL
jgi:hypothetical protein